MIGTTLGYRMISVLYLCEHLCLFFRLEGVDNIYSAFKALFDDYIHILVLNLVYVAKEQYI